MLLSADTLAKSFYSAISADLGIVNAQMLSPTKQYYSNTPVTTVLLFSARWSQVQ
ncbi:hypothetical protein BKA66DRAFT_473373 [Pyrenochaeta sp. MPI-SDFR-AT-0127]|nr:hypothetical protein BKA66DRAFT_473373 [Pyrenochaeta sp. MPI-SDFR-AT-0127]